MVDPSEPGPDDVLPGGRNWPLLVLIAFVPLQNIYLGKLPMLASGINAINILTLIALVWAVFLQKTSFSNPLNKYVILLALTYFLSFLALTLRVGWDWQIVYDLKDFLLGLLLYFLTYKSLTGVRAIRSVLWATVAPLPYMFKVFYTNLSWMGFSAYQDKLRLNNGTFLFLGSNEIAAFYATYTFVLIGFALSQHDFKRRIILWVCIGMNAYCVLYSFSRSAYIASILGVTIMLLVNRKVKPILLGSVFLCIFLFTGLITVPRAVSDRFNSAFVDQSELDESARRRVELWDSALDQFKSHPIFGGGFGSFRTSNRFGMDSHNFYMKVLAETGLVGFGALVLFLGASLRTGFALLNTTALGRSLAVGFLACFAALIFGNVFGDRFTHYPLIAYFCIYLAVMAKLLNVHRESSGLK